MITIVGLGPGDASHLTGAARAAMESGTRVILRTRHHPAVEGFGGTYWLDCDDLYSAGTAFIEVYDAVVTRVMQAHQDGDVVFAVPGHPLFAEHSVVKLLETAQAAGISTLLVPGLSFVDLAIASLRIDGGDLQIGDALSLQIDPRRPVLVHQVFDRDSASGAKLRLLEWFPPEHEVVVLRALGTERETLERVPLHGLDHKAYGYLDCLYVPPIAPLDDVRRFEGAYHVVVERLNAAAGGCPWDLEQTHASLKRYLLEETYEVLEAIDSGDRDQLVAELGDLLFQVLEHTAVAAREGTFTFGDISERLIAKLVHRHPHVFGDLEIRTASETEAIWEQLKEQEAPRESALGGIPATLPALQASQSIQGRARKAGFDWPDMSGPLAKLAEEIQEFAEAEDPASREDEFGDILFVLAGIGARLGLDAEQALRGANAKFRRRFAEMERAMRADGTPLVGLSLDELLAGWVRAKRAVD